MRSVTSEKSRKRDKKAGSHLSAQYSSDDELFSEAEIDTVMNPVTLIGSQSSRSSDSKGFHHFDRRRQSRFFILSMFFLLVVSMGFVMTFLLDDNLLHQFRHTKRQESSLSFDYTPLVNCTPLAVNQFPQVSNKKIHDALN